MNLAHSLSEKKNTILITAKEETSHVSHPASASDTYFMIMAEGFPNSGLYHSFSLKRRGYSWLSTQAHRPSRCRSAWTIYQVRSLIYHSQFSFVPPRSVSPSGSLAPRVCTADVPVVIWNAAVYQASSLFYKTTRYGVKSYVIGNYNYKVDQCLNYSLMMFPACWLIASLGVVGYSSCPSGSLTLKASASQIWLPSRLSWIFTNSLHALGSISPVVLGSAHSCFYFLDSHFCLCRRKIDLVR